LRRPARIVFRGRDPVPSAGRRHFLPQPLALLVTHAPSGRRPVLELAASSGRRPILSGPTGRWPVLLLLTRLALASLTAVAVAAATPLLRVRLGGEHAGSSNYGKNPQGSLHDVMDGTSPDSPRLPYEP